MGLRNSRPLGRLRLASLKEYWHLWSSAYGMLAARNRAIKRISMGGPDRGGQSGRLPTLAMRNLVPLSFGCL